MSLSVAAMRLLAEKGLTLDDVIAVAAANEAERVQTASDRKKSRDAQRMRDKRERERLSRDVAATSYDSLSLPPTPPNPISELPPSPPKGGSSPKGASRPKASKRVPVEWLPRPGDLALADAEGFAPGEIEREIAKFRDHEFRVAHSDWDATFRKWIRTAAERRQPHERPHQSAGPSPKFVARQANLERAFAGFEIAAGGGAGHRTGGS